MLHPFQNQLAAQRRHLFHERCFRLQVFARVSTHLYWGKFLHLSRLHHVFHLMRNNSQPCCTDKLYNPSRKHVARQRSWCFGTQRKSEQGGLARSKRSELAPHRLIAAHRRPLLFERLVQAKGRSAWFKTSPENEVNFRDIGNGQFDCPQNKIGKRWNISQVLFFLVDVLMLLLIIVRGVAGREKKNKKRKQERN